MPPKTAEQKARKKAADAAKKVANKAGAPAASPTPAPEAEAEAPLPTPPTSSSVQTESVASPNSPSPAPSASYANNSASGLLCLPLDSLAYALTFLPAREIGATMISSSYIAKTVLPVFQQKFLISRCKYMLPTPPDTKIHVNESMLHASAVITHAANCGVDLVHKAVSKLNKKILKSSNAGSSSSSAPPPLLSSDPSTGSLSFATYARFLDEAIGGRSSLRIGAGEDDPILPQHTAGRFASCSPEHSVIRAGGGDKKGGGSGIMAWGVGKRGQLGAGKREDNSTPSPVYNGIGFRVRVVQVAAGGGLVRVAHTLLLTDGGRVLSFGCAMYGALGHGFSAGSQLPDEIRPRIIEALLSERVTHVAAGELHSACVTSDGDCYTWGEGFCGQLGQIDKRPSLTPGQVKDELEDEICLSVSCGARHTIVLTEDGEMFSFGLGYFGVLGRSFTPFEFGAKNTGIEQEIEEGEAVEEGAAAASSAPAEAETMGDVLSTATAGLNLSKEQEVNLENLTITLEDSSDQTRPRKIEAMEGIKVVAISAGHRHNLCLDEHGSVYSWGSGGGGGLGHGDTVKRAIPERIAELQLMTADDDTRVVNIAAGVDASMVVLKNGDVYSWGRTKGGRIGLSNNGGNVSQPRKVQLGEYDRKAVACDVGYVHSLIVLNTGQVLQCGKVGVDDEADGAEEPLEGEGVARLLPGESLNCWQRNREPIELKKVVKYEKYGTYATKGRTATKEATEKWNPNDAK